MYIHGTMNPERDGKWRLNTKTGDLEFELWKEGEQGHKKPYWHKTGWGWIDNFVAGYPTEKIKADRLEF